MLKLNDNKTELILFGSPYFLAKVPKISIRVSDTNIISQNSGRNLGVMFDSSLSLDKFVNSKISSTHYHLRNISAIRCSLTSDAAKLMIHSYITSRLDYCNGLLLGITRSNLKKLQRVQDLAARIIIGGKTIHNITGTIKCITLATNMEKLYIILCLL
jgi:hypothetical protein